MNKEKLRIFLCGVSVGLVLLLLCGSALADATTRQLTAIYNNIKIYVDGELISPKDVNGKPTEPFIVEGSTYLPVRAVAEALGKPVDWDGPNQSVYIGERPTDIKFIVIKPNVIYNTKLGEIESVTADGGKIEIVHKDSVVGEKDRILSVNNISYILRNPPIAKTSDYTYYEYVPMLPVLGLLGADLYWAEAEDYYVCYLAGHEIIITPTKSQYIIDGIPIDLTYAPIYVDGQLMFSLRLLINFTNSTLKFNPTSSKYEFTESTTYNVLSSQKDLSILIDEQRPHNSYDETLCYNYVINGRPVDFGKAIAYNGLNDEQFFLYSHVPFKQLVEELGISYTEDKKNNIISCKINNRNVLIDTAHRGIYGDPEDHGYITNNKFIDRIYKDEIYSNISIVDILFPECTIGYHPLTRTYFVDSIPVDYSNRPPLTYYWHADNHPELFPVR